MAKPEEVKEDPEKENRPRPEIKWEARTFEW
jgi:hypothetical protein